MVVGAFPSWTNVRAAYRAVGGRDGRPDAFDSARVDDPGKPGLAVTHHANLIREHRRRKAVRH